MFGKLFNNLKNGLTKTAKIFLPKLTFLILLCSIIKINIDVNTKVK